MSKVAQQRSASIGLPASARAPLLRCTAPGATTETASPPVDGPESILADERVEDADRDLRLPTAAVAGEAGIAPVPDDAQRDRMLLGEPVHEQRIAAHDVVVPAARA